MSRVGKKAIPVPDKVKVNISGGVVRVQGPGGKLERAIPAGVSVAVDGGAVKVERDNDSRTSRQRHGLVRTLINNMVVGVTEGFSKELEIVGVGYRCEQKAGYLWFSLGYSHPILYEVPPNVKAEIQGVNKVKLLSADRELLGQTAATIRSFRPPEPYKGKGIRYKDEVVRSKVGKAGGA